jgi:ribosomal protein S6
MQYELFYLIGERQESRTDEIKGGVEAILTQEGATMVESEVVEKRKLAYEIKHQKRGTYVTRRFELPEIDFWADEKNGEREFGIEAITKKLNLNNDVLRFLIVKTNDLPDLGAKKRRQEKEMGEAKKPTPEQSRPLRPMTKREEVKKAEEKVETPAPAAVAAPVVEEKVVEEKKTEADSQKDIDKQLDELLNI